MAMLYGHEVRVTASGAQFRAVTCENCACQYLYRLTRRVSKSSVLTVPDHAAESTQQQLGASAQRQLDRHLRKAVDPVSCPDCGYLQRAMVRTVKLERFGWLILIAMALGFVTLVTYTLSAVEVLPFAAPVILAVLVVTGLLTASAWSMLPRLNSPGRMARRLQTPCGSAIRKTDVPEELLAELFADDPMSRGS
jgi:hypothetical protein